MKMTKMVAISAFGILLSACSATQSQIEGAGAVIAADTGTGPAHIHNIEGFGDLTHQHPGNSTPAHGHSWEDVQREIQKQKQ